MSGSKWVDVFEFTFFLGKLDVRKDHDTRTS